MPRDALAPLDPVRAAGLAVIALEREADVAAATERARDVFASFPHTEPAIGSAAWLEQGKLQRKLEHEAAGRRIRAIYFAVTDIGFRKRLIAAHRQMDEAHQLAAANSVLSARRELYSQLRRAGILYAEAFGAPLVAVAAWAVYAWGGFASALALTAALVAALLTSLALRTCRRDAVMRTAEERLLAEERAAEATYALGYTFSRLEERTGEPDPRV